MLLIGLQGCAFVSSESVYEGVRATRKARTAGSEPQPNELPPYDQYERERQQSRR